MKRLLIHLAFGAYFLFASCGMATEADVNTLVAGNTTFALDLYGKLRTQPGNLFFSPYSISTALAMTYGGTGGDTAKQMAQTLHFDLPADKLHPAFAALESGLKEVQQKGKIKLASANSLWPQKGYPFLPDYIALCQKDYGTSITPVDFASAPDAARKTINEWVENRTNKKIVELLKPGVLSAQTRLVLANAIYFKGSWASRFDAKLTTDEPFHISATQTVKAPLMHQNGKFRCAEADGLRILELPYAGDDLSLIVLLPDTVEGLGKLEAKLTTQNLSTWTAAAHYQRLDVVLPKFKATLEFSLGQTLAAMGMPDAFSGAADFSGMDGKKDLFISAVVHKAFVDVNEEGTEAAAATGIGVGALAVERPPPAFRADHPFVFLIRDNHTGSVLFLGRIVNPNS